MQLDIESSIFKQEEFLAAYGVFFSHLMEMRSGAFLKKKKNSLGGAKQKLMTATFFHTNILQEQKRHQVPGSGGLQL